MAQGLEGSVRLHFESIAQSCEDVPSNDRISSSLLMSVNLQSMILGTSVLSIPLCLKLCGVWALILIFLLGALACFVGVVLRDCQYQESITSRPGQVKRINISFVDMATACWEKAGSYVMQLLVYLSLARNIIMLILLTDTACDILGKTLMAQFDRNVIPVFWTVMTLPLLYIKRVSYLSWVCFIGLNLYIVALGFVFVLCIMHWEHWDITNISTKFDIQGIGLSCGIIINSYAVHMNLPALEGSMKHPSNYNRTTATTFIVNIVLKIVLGIAGYLTYLDETDQEITGNVHLFKPLPQLLSLAVMFFSYFTIPIQSFVVFELIDEKWRPHFPVFDRFDFLWWLLTRLVCMVAVLWVSMVLPHFSIVVSLIGSIRGSMICLILPAAFYIKLGTHKKTKVKIFFSWMAVVCGTLAGLAGTYASISAIVNLED